MFSVLDLIVLSIGAAMLLLWIVFFIIGLKHASLFENLDEKEYPLREIYFIGYAIMNMTGYKYKSKQDRKLRKELIILYGNKYAEYYIRVIYAQRVTFAFLLIVLGFALYGLMNTIAITAVMLMFAGTAFYYFGTVTGSKLLKRSEEMLGDFSEVVSKLALLTNAGMIMREAWAEVAYTGETSIYVEMRKSVEEINNGVSEVDALYNFGIRCSVPEIKKFTSTIIQGIIKGNNELTYMLKEQSKEVWGAKKQYVRRQGEKANSKLMIPIMMIFVGILIMVIVPIFANLGV